MVIFILFMLEIFPNNNQMIHILIRQNSTKHIRSYSIVTQNVAIPSLTVNKYIHFTAL